MKKIRYILHGISKIIQNTKLRQKMIIIYLVGGMLPLICVSLYNNNQSSKILLSASQEAQKEEVYLVGSSISESMSVLTNAVRSVSYNKQVRKILTKDYSKSNAFPEDCNSIAEIKNFINNYSQDISNIVIYIANETVPIEQFDDTKNFAYMSDSIKSQKWYKETIYNEEMEYWYYYTNPDTNRVSLQVTRAIRDDDNNVIAIVSVMMQNYRTSKIIDDRSVDTMLLFNNSEVIYSNISDEEKYRFAIETLDKNSGDESFSKKLINGVEEYLLFYQRVENAGGTECYSIVSIQNYRSILSNITRMSVVSFFPIVLGMLFSLVLIVIMTYAFDKRIRQLSVQMHRVANGEYDKVQPMDGKDEVGQLYRELDVMMKDIQKLLENVVYEQVQKEKIHTRQKEVEFKMLASQINPHFLYNTLETIRMKAMVNKQKEIEELVKMLAKIMRYNIQVTESLVTIKSEVKMVGYYLKIQNYRFGDRIFYEIKIDKDVDTNALTMPLIIQPFVENAFAHGLEEKEADGKLIIHIKKIDNNIKIIIKDNGVGMTYFKLGKLRNAMKSENMDSTHIGITNVNQRIKMMYGDEYGVKISSEKNKGTTISITIPFRIGQN